METYGETMNRIGEADFTGREFELALFRAMLKQTGSGNERIMNVYGTGGIGKSALVSRFLQAAEQAGARCIRIQLRELVGDAALFQQELADSLELVGAEGQETVGLSRLLQALHAAADGGKLVLALDQYEEVGSIDHWLRETFFPRLSSDILVVIAGRYPLGGPWTLSPVWRKLILPLPLGGLRYEEVKAYLNRQGITDEETIDRLWFATSGHPLSLALLASDASKSGGGPLRAKMRQTFDQLLLYWLQEVPDDRLRSLVYAASIPRFFDQELLQAIIGEPVPDAEFYDLTRRSFVNYSGQGWQLHDLVRHLVQREFRERVPDTYAQFCDRSAALLSARIRAKREAGLTASGDIYELIGQKGNPILRAHFRFSRSSENYWEEVTPLTLPEAERYIDRRKADCRTFRIACSDAESDTVFRYEIEGEASLFRFSGWDAEDLVRFGGDALRLLRSPDGHVIGLAAMLPIREDTLPYLRQSPVSGPYFRAHESGSKIDAPVPQKPGRFVFAVDVINPEKMELRSDTVNLMMEHILSGTLLIASPPALPFYVDSHQSMGFAAVPDLQAPYRYNDDIEAITYRIDTRGIKLAAFLEHVSSYRLNTEKGKESGGSLTGLNDSDLFGFTRREMEVAGILATGATNKEIAASLYISEAAVKKHINAMLQKTGLRNRTQIAAALLDAFSDGSRGNPPS